MPPALRRWIEPIVGTVVCLLFLVLLALLIALALDLPALAALERP